MQPQDARALSASAQEALRYRVVKAVQAGMSKSEAARVFSISRTAVHHWTKAAALGGEQAVKAKRQGRPQQSSLLREQVQAVVELITQQCPDALGLPFYLWTREAVRQLLAERFELSVSVWTVERYLWGLTPQKPLRRAYQQDPKAVQRWLQTQYPAMLRSSPAGESPDPLGR
jgi:transposase